MTPDLEVVQIGQGQSFTAWEHGYPFHTVRWHFHPELEVHLVVATQGRYYIGDFIGEFGPGNLVLTGPNLPHNWVSDVADGATVPLRSRVLQFPEDLLLRIAELFPDTGGFAALFNLSRRGALFSDACSEVCAPILAELVQAKGPRRASLFLDLLAHLAADAGARALASDTYLPDPSGFMTAGVNKALAYINLHSPSGVSFEVKIACIRALDKDFLPQAAPAVAQTAGSGRIRPRSRCFLAQGRRFSAQRTDLSSRFRSV